MFWKKESTKQQIQNFDIDSEKLIINGKTIAKQTLELLQEKKIKLHLNFFDSDSKNTKKRTIIIIHGNSASKKVFDKEIEHYCQENRVIVIDLLGHGKSTKFSLLDTLTKDEKEKLAETFYNPCAMIAEIVQFIASKNICNAHIMGWSLGGQIAYGIGIQNPNLVSSITTIGAPPVRFSQNGFKKAFTSSFIEMVIPFWIKNPQFTPLDKSKQIAAQLGFADQQLNNFAKSLANSDPLMRRHLFLNLAEYDKSEYIGTPLDAEKFVKETNIPLCLLFGELDTGIAKDYFNQIEKNFVHPKSSVQIINNVGHAAFLSDKFYSLEDEFISLKNT